ncbi:hypothetical protein SLNSH_07530 [Alsobacter soli]|uniref:Uncharacterized protein n=1 Tax=Alsobacter soli TaxID=2109933 RepID=A0A2T1HW22_9HYPH|nr:hypothetical protein [Alsobacter soli]PSC05818.1 hypothetical protein SLNSH_07530 [Alsobacter soli]
MDELAALRRRRGLPASRTHPRQIMEAVYEAGSVSLSPDETLSRIVAAQLHRMGLLLVEEITPEGGLRPLAPDTMANARLRPWRVSRPAIAGGLAGEPDAVGAAV